MQTANPTTRPWAYTRLIALAACQLQRLHVFVPAVCAGGRKGKGRGRKQQYKNRLAKTVHVHHNLSVHMAGGVDQHDVLCGVCGGDS